MPRRTLLDFLSDLESTPSTAAADFLTYDDGYRTWTWTYAQLADASAAFAARLADASIRGGDAIAIWSENRPEWIAALWGCLLEGVVLVPIDYRASPEFLLKVAGIVNARGVIVGDTVDADSLGTSRVIWRTSELRAHGYCTQTAAFSTLASFLAWPTERDTAGGSSLIVPFGPGSTIRGT